MVFVIVMLLFVASGIKTGDTYTVFISILSGFYVGFILQICWGNAKYIVNSPKKRKQMYLEIKQQEKYDNDWGIIEYKDNEK